jgi:PIN domain nuclease of toxin-antitoxin system
MRLLLDTHIALWAVTNSPKLSQKARALITAEDNDVYVSAVSIWEITIKHMLGRGDMPVSGERAAQIFVQTGFLELGILYKHAIAVSELPAIHQDPFDRMLIAQAQTEQLLLLTHDSLMQEYAQVLIV